MGRIKGVLYKSYRLPYFLVLASETQFGTTSRDTITTDNDFVVNIDKRGTVSIDSGKLGDGGTPGFEMIFLVIALISLLMIERRKR